MRWRALVARPGCYIVYCCDSDGKLCGMYAATRTEDLHWMDARLVARFAQSA